MLIVSASRQTDIPAFYADWLMQRLRAGFCHWRHPYTGQVYTLSLKPAAAVVIAFWTRYPIPLLPYLDELTARGFHYYFLFTLTGYPAPLETRAPALPRGLAAFKALAERVTPERVCWKYDPIIFSALTPPQYHVDRFGAIAEQLNGYTHRCGYAWLLMLEQVQRNLARAHPAQPLNCEPPTQARRHSLLTQLVPLAQANHIEVYSCFSDDYRNIPGVQPGSCIDLQVVRRLTGQPQLTLPAAAEWARALQPDAPRPLGAQLRSLAGRVRRTLTAASTDGVCQCAAAVDIGVPNTCLFDCAYCLANANPEQARLNHQTHNPADTLLCRPAHLHTSDLSQCALPDPYGNPPPDAS